MPTGDGERADPTEQTIEATPQPGRFVSHGAAWSLIEGLEKVAAQIAALVDSSPWRAVALYETFVAGCYEKAEELDDSGRRFGSFVASLFSGWAKARGAAGADPEDTACRLLAWMDAGFEEVVAGGGPSAKPSFLERTKARWGRAPGG